MNKLLILLLALLILNHCSFSEKSRIWKDKEKLTENNSNIKKVFLNEKKIVTEFNSELKLNLNNIKVNNKIIDNKNNYGSQSYNGTINKIANYKYSKLEEVNLFNLKPIFLNGALIFFDKSGSVIRYDKSQKIIWKKNYYSKSEKKLKPKLNFVLDNENLLVADSIAKYYSINVNSGKLNWSKNNTYPFNSEIKKYKIKIFVIDYKNTLKCYYINDGSECWNLQTEGFFYNI